MSAYVISSNFSILAHARQVITAKEWREFLKNYDRNVFCNGDLRELKAKSLGAGMVEIRSVPFRT